MPVNPDDIERRCLAYEGVLDFARYTHPRWRDGPHHKLICDALEKLARGEIRKLMIEAPPRHGKTELASRRFPAWYLGHHPDRQILAITHSDDLAKDNGRDVLEIVKDETFREVFQTDLTLTEDAQAAGRWRTKQGGIYYTRGIGGSITGRGFDIGIIDDFSGSREDADSPRLRQVAWDWYWGTFDTRTMENGARLIMTTRWRKDDLCGMLLDIEADEWTVLRLPAIAFEETDHEAVLWPEKFPLAWMREKRESLRRASKSREWCAQYQQEPTVEQGTYCQRSWYTERYTDPPITPAIYIVSDLAATEPKTGKREPDFTEHGVFAIGSDGRLYPVEWWHRQATSDVWIKALLELCRKWKPLAWFVGKEPIWRAAEPLFKRMCLEERVYMNVQEVANVADKATRGQSFQGWSSMGRVVFPRAGWAERVIDQCCEFPAGQWDDAFDVCATMCLVIDNAHPAVQPVAQAPKREREWVSTTTAKSQTWKTK